MTAPSQEKQEEPYIEDEGPIMGFLDHVDELRIRLTRAILALLITTSLSMIFTGDILRYLISAAPGGSEAMALKLQILGPTESIVVYFRVALTAGAILSMPIITWQLFGFIMPGLTRSERRWVLLSLPGVTLFFLLGVMFAWFMMTPAALKFLAEFQSDVFDVQWTADAYIAFVTALVFWIGVAFEMPLVFFVFGRLGLIGPGALARNWRLAVVATAIIAAMITPTVDPFNMGLVMGPLLVLYALSILLTAIAYRRSDIGQQELQAKKKRKKKKQPKP